MVSCTDGKNTKKKHLLLGTLHVLQVKTARSPRRFQVL